MHQESSAAFAPQTHLRADHGPVRIAASSSEPATQQSLFDRSTDFWLMGGASCLFWLAMTTLGAYREQMAFGRFFQSVAGFSGLMVLFVNYPHFMVSYKIAYGRGWKFVVQHWLQLIFVPLAMLALIGFSYATFSDPSPLPRDLNPYRIAAGEGLLALLISFMFVTVGWHYVKQTFGCMMVYSSFDRYKLSIWQRRTLLAVLYLTWFSTLIGAHVGHRARSEFYGLPLMSLGLPSEIKVALDLAFWVALAVFLYCVPLHNWRKHGQKPSMNFLIPLVALTVWWNPLFYNRDFYFLLVPLFHSLQYIPFAAKYERNRLKERNPHWLFGGTAIVLCLIVAGFASFDFIPGLGKSFPGSTGPSDVLFFVIAAHGFINIHHYFIDNVIWRFHHPDVQKYLLGRVTA